MMFVGGGSGLPAPAVWHDASNLASITDAGAGACSQWNDISGNGHHLTSTGTQRPLTGTRTINSLNCIDFDGSNDMMAAATGFIPTGAVGLTLFMVTQQDSTANASMGALSMLNGGLSANDLNGVLMEFRTNKYAFAMGGGSSSASAGSFNAYHEASGTANTTNPHVIRVTVSTAGFEYAVDGTVKTLASFASGGAAQPANFLASLAGADLQITVGMRNSGSFPYNGAIAEIRGYNSVLAAGELTAIQAALKAKWGTP